jgi:hypothetical protein
MFGKRFTVLYQWFTYYRMYQNAMLPHATCPSKWLRMKPLHRGFQRCIDFEHCVSITVVANIHRFGGELLGSLQYVVLIPIVEIHRPRARNPWCTIQATHSKLLIMKPLHYWFQWCIDLWHSVSIRVIIEVRDAWIWLFWCQYNIHEFLCSTWPKIVTLV